MKNIDEFFNQETMDKINEIVSENMPVLNELQDFKNKDELLSNTTDNFKNLLSEKQSTEFDNIMKLSYTLNQYYFTLAYLLGSKNINNSDNL